MEILKNVQFIKLNPDFMHEDKLEAQIIELAKKCSPKVNITWSFNGRKKMCTHDGVIVELNKDFLQDLMD